MSRAAPTSTPGPAPAAARGAAPWQLAHPLWLCAFRPFFALAAIAAWGSMAAWAGFLFLGWPLPAVPGGPFVWHVHELLVGFALAAVAGFALTGIPEFTDTPSFAARPVRVLVLLWLLARVAFWLSGWWPHAALALAGLANLALLGGLMALVAPRLWRDPERRHLSFLWAIAAIAVTVAGFYVDALRGVAPMRWLHALLGVLMALIVVAMSRVSTSILNANIDALAGDGIERDPYLARPPRRNMALLTIVLHTLAQFWQPAGRVSAWLALAAACAVLNLLNDWHVGRPLLRRWPLMLYAVYVFIAAGYALIGVALLGGEFSVNAGVHLLTVGGVGLNVYIVMCIAGYTHSGLEKDGRTWIPVGAAMLGAAAVLRAGAYAYDARLAMSLAAGLWIGAYVLLSRHLLPVFVRARADGAEGCAGIMVSGR